MKKSISHSIKKIAKLLSVSLVISCSINDEVIPDEEKISDQLSVIESQYKDMLLVKSKGKSFKIGSDAESAPSDAKPAMKVSFDYDYHMDKYEVTQGDFAKLMGYDAPKYSERNLPATMVNWYEAIYYSNQRSKVAGLDTVYSYTKVNYGADGNIQNIEGLKASLEVFGYRLPTEAEWEYVAQWNLSGPLGEMAWTSVNSELSIHEVGSKNSGHMGFYDLQGNAMEWVNDWKGFFQNQEVRNFLGAPFPNSISERIVKGGSFKHDEIFLLPSYRSDVYPLGSEGRTNYIGFRCALGAIVEGNFLSKSGVVDSESPVQIITTYTEIKSKLGNQSKLAFVNRVTEKINWIDLSQTILRVQEIEDASPAFHPVISPDGNYIAYGTKIEGANGNSEVYVHSLLTNQKIQLEVSSAAIPRWWVNPTTQKIYLVYTDYASSNQNLETWSSGSTWKIEFAGGKFIGTPIELTNVGGFNGGIDSTGQFLASGYTSLMTLNRGNKKQSTLFESPDNGKTSDGSSQVCNVSVKPTGSPELLFIDFGYTGQSTITGGSYGIHELLFRTDQDGQILQYYKVPEDEKGWDHTEWSNNPKFAVATTTNAAEDHHAIYMIDLEDSSYVHLVEGENLWHPNLWIGKKLEYTGDLNLDSLGNYSEPSNVLITEFSYRARLFWNKHKDVDGIILGSSRPSVSVAPSEITQANFFNFSVVHGDLSIIERIFFDYIVNHTPNLKYLVLSLDFDWYNRGTEWFDSNIAPSEGYQYDKSHNFWINGLPDDYLNLFNNAKYDVTMASAIDSNGWRNDDLCNSWGEVEPPTHGDFEWDINHVNYAPNIQRLERILQLTQAMGVQVVGIIFPQSPHYKNTLYEGLYGPTRTVATKILQELNNLTVKYPNLSIMDENQSGYHSYPDNEARNWDHLCPLGAVKLSKRLNDHIKGL